MKLANVMIGSENSKILGDFYTKVLGKPGWQQNDWYGFDLEGNYLMIGPHSEVHGKNDAPGRIMFVLQTDDVQAEFSRIKELGAEVIADPYQPDKDRDANAWLATFADSDGNYFQLLTPMKM
jgi:predicted enzyme related to lactoylglutathione lyase